MRDTQHVATDPLGAIRAQLVDAARRRRASKRRRRRAATVAAAAVGLLAAASGAIAITSTETGVPEIDRLLDFASRHVPEPAGDPQAGHEPLPPGVKPPGPPDVRPTEGSVSPPFEVPLGDGRRALSVGYESRDGMFCSAIAEPGAPLEATPAGVTCVSPRLLAADLEKEGARVVGGGSGGPETTAVQGFAREDVEGVTVITRSGRFEATLSDPWSPRGGVTLRVFYALVQAPERVRWPVTGLEVEP